MRRYSDRLLTTANSRSCSGSSSGPEVTKACLTCHTEASRQIHQTQHWKWEYVNPGTGQTLGKRHVINNFCTSVSSNYKACASCHIGYGLKDKNFDFASEKTWIVWSATTPPANTRSPPASPAIR
jgi:hypothetical protein